MGQNLDYAYCACASNKRITSQILNFVVDFLLNISRCFDAVCTNDYTVSTYNSDYKSHILSNLGKHFFLEILDIPYIPLERAVEK